VGDGSPEIENEVKLIDLFSRLDIISFHLPDWLRELPPITNNTLFPNSGIIL
jgi:hypothetical protein